MHAKMRVVVWRVVAMSYFRLAQIEGLAIRRSTTRHLACIVSDKTTVRQRTVWRFSLATRRQGDNDIGCVVAINNATRKMCQISHHTLPLNVYYIISTILFIASSLVPIQILYFTGMTELLKSIRLFILLMCHYQDIQTRLQAEIDNVIGICAFIFNPLWYIVHHWSYKNSFCFNILNVTKYLSCY
jgi:hypothetical protein